LTASAAHPAASPDFVPPYALSWFDRLSVWVEARPLPPWVSYLALGLVGILLQIGLQAGLGTIHRDTNFPFLAWFSGQIAYLLALMHYLDRSAITALENFHPVLHVDPHPGGGHEAQASSYDEFRYRLTTMPPGNAWLAALVGAVAGTVLPTLFIRSPQAAGTSPVQSMTLFGLTPSNAGFVVMILHLALTEAVAGTFVYHTIHQLRMINQTYQAHARINLYRLQPLYAFSAPAAMTAAGLLLFNYAWFATAPALLSQWVSLAMGAFFALVATATFALPLLGIHRRLVDEKKRLISESAGRFEEVVAELHQRVDRRELSQMDDLNKTLLSLDLEQGALRRVATWPWEAGTLRGVVATLVLPVVIWMIQYVLQKLFG
jgi:hypothetical protein